MSQKIIRDPLYNYVTIDRKSDGWLLELLDTPEVQRLRRIHQLGVSHLTYPGAEHSRLSHSLGVLHLMQIAIEHLGMQDPQVRQARERLLAAALLHDVGHGPFSHLFEPCLGIDHEDWTCRILKESETSVHRILRGVDPTLPGSVAALVDKKNTDFPRWQKSLLSSQLDVDRLDYLRRDSLFTGAGYGHYDWYRLLHTMEFHGGLNVNRDLVWHPKAELAIEEYIFSRYYMYWNVYLHKTTRGFEQTIQALWRHANQLRQDGTDVGLLPTLKTFLESNEASGSNGGTEPKKPTTQQFLAIEESTVLEQMQVWADGSHRALSDLSGRFLHRVPWAAIDAPEPPSLIAADYQAWERALMELVGSHSEYQPADLYCLRDEVKSKYVEPYFPEREEGEQEVGNAIRLAQPEGEPVEISEKRPRLEPVTRKPPPKVRYFVPKDLRTDAVKLQKGFASS